MRTPIARMKDAYEQFLTSFLKEYRESPSLVVKRHLGTTFDLALDLEHTVMLKKMRALMVQSETYQRTRISKRSTR